MIFIKKIFRWSFHILKLLKLAKDNKDTQSMRHEEVVDFIKNNIQNKTISILDVGCGTGNILKKLKNQGFSELQGCDWLQGLDHSDYLYTQVDLNKDGLYKYMPNSFDLLICSDVIEHLENPALTLREFYRVLKPHGKAIVTIPNAWNIQERLIFLLTANSSRYTSERHSAPFGHISFFTTDILESLLDRSKMKLINVYPGDNYFLGFNLKLPKKLIFSYNVLLYLGKEE